MARNHVVGQALLQKTAQLRGGGRLIFVRGREPGHQLFAPARGLAGVHCADVDQGMLAEYRLDLTRLDAETAHFDLIILAPDEFDIAGGQPAGQVAGFVHAEPRPSFEHAGLRIRLEAAAPQGGCAIRPYEGIGQEAFGGEIGAMEVAAGEAQAGDVEFALDAHRHGIVCIVQNVEAVVGEGLADGDHLIAGQLQALAFEVATVHGGFGQAKGVDEPGLGSAETQEAAILPRVPAIGGADEHPHEGQIPAVFLQPPHEIAQHRRHKLGNSHLLRHHQAIEVGRGEEIVAGNENEFPAGEQTPHQVAGENVEGKIGHLQMAAGLIQQAVGFLPAFVGVHQAAMGQCNALGLARAARGVDDVDQVVGRDADVGRGGGIGVQRPMSNVQCQDVRSLELDF